jgi:tRNA1(Val) A37 N6-methylase TrmN6
MRLDHGPQRQLLQVPELREHLRLQLSTLAVAAAESRKLRGAFFTPQTIAGYLAEWAIANNPAARILDPTCGDGSFLVAAAELLMSLGANQQALSDQVVGIEVDAETAHAAMMAVQARDLDATVKVDDFFRLSPPSELFPSLGTFDAVVGNPPFVRYQHHAGEARRFSMLAALKQGVRLSGLASSWPAVLIHAAAFLKPEGKLAMVLPAEAMSVGYAEPVRQWLKHRFSAVRLVLFERLQFPDAEEDVVLLLAEGAGHSDAFSLYYVSDADDLRRIRPFQERPVALAPNGKWTDLFLTGDQRALYRDISSKAFVPLSAYGTPMLGTVTGANDFFVVSDETRVKYGLRPSIDVRQVIPAGSKAPRGLAYRQRDWDQRRAAGDAVWVLDPNPADLSPGLRDYLEVGERRGVPLAYKCRSRPHWWKPPVVEAPALFFTYMSHHVPRIVDNRSSATILNSMHGIQPAAGVNPQLLKMIPLLSLNSMTLLGAELNGRAYGGGVLKLEPREASRLPVPAELSLREGAARLSQERASLERLLLGGQWTSVVARVNEVLLHDVLGVPFPDIERLHEAASWMRVRRTSRRATPA